jgi:hypothetical protein
MLIASTSLTSQARLLKLSQSIPQALSIPQDFAFSVHHFELHFPGQFGPAGNLGFQASPQLGAVSKVVWALHILVCCMISQERVSQIQTEIERAPLDRRLKEIIED